MKIVVRNEQTLEKIRERYLYFARRARRKLNSTMVMCDVIATLLNFAWFGTRPLLSLEFDFQC